MGRNPSIFIRLREDIRLGQRIDKVPLWMHGTRKLTRVWVIRKEVATAQSIGSCRLWRVSTTTTDKVRVR